LQKKIETELKWHCAEKIGVIGVLNLPRAECAPKEKEEGNEFGILWA